MNQQPFLSPSIIKDLIVLIVLSISAGISVSIFLQVTKLLEIDTLWVMKHLLFIPTLFLWLYLSIYNRSVDSSNQSQKCIVSLNPKKLTIGLVVLSCTLLILNLMPLAKESVDFLVILHIPLGLWLITGFAMNGFSWKSTQGNIDFVNYSGNLAIFYGLIGLVSMVVLGILALLLQTQGIDLEPFFEQWLLPFGATAALYPAYWLSISHKKLVSQLGTTLTSLLVPLLVLVLVFFVILLIVRNQGFMIDRDGLLVYTIILILVYSLFLYSITLRKPQKQDRIQDFFLMMMLVFGILIDGIALISLGNRLITFGITANRFTTLVTNVLLLVNLSGSLYLLVQRLRTSAGFERLLSWQARYMVVFAGWVCFVIILFPILF